MHDTENFCPSEAVLDAPFLSDPFGHDNRRDDSTEFKRKIYSVPA